MITGQASDQITPRGSARSRRCAGRAVASEGGCSVRRPSRARQVNRTGRTGASRRLSRSRHAAITAISLASPPGASHSALPRRRGSRHEQKKSKSGSRRRRCRAAGSSPGSPRRRARWRSAAAATRRRARSDPDAPLPDPSKSRHRARRRPDDGEPLVRPHARLAADAGRRAGRPRVRRQSRDNGGSRRGRSRPGSRAASTATRTTATGAAASSSTTAPTTAGCARRPTTTSRSASYRQQDLSFYGGAVPGVDHARPLLLRDPELDVPQPHVHARGTDRPHHQHAQSSTLPAIWDRVAAARSLGAYYRTTCR